MLRFFKKVRQGLLREGKISKYLLYAFGEIILVVLGILIALQINNWNEKRKTTEKQEKLLSSLLSDAQTTQTRLLESQEMAESINDDLLYFLNEIQKEQLSIPIDTLKAYTSMVFQVANFKPALSAYETALSTGDISLVKNDELLDKYIQFKNNYEWFELHQNISGDMVYLGSIWEFRKKLGSTRMFMKNMGSYPASFDVSDEEFFRLLQEKETFATFENMQWLVRNQYDALRRADDANIQILELLQTALKEE
ncbi:DUF6090 family protein [Flagellimonas sp. S174]|uniref:DUF6090 family protein n=1 Tax=Flagellimonas sp. S174 TaxID=3410790 RepID=UPI003BF52ABF